MSKHTDGPWAVVGVGESSRMLVVRSPSHRVATIHSRLNTPPEQYQADAALIAAAPDLLAALEGILPIAEAARHALGLDIDQRIRLDDARAAVAKAKPVDVATLEVEPWE